MTVLSMTDRVTEGLSKFHDDGYAVVYAGLDSGALFELGTLLDTKHPGERNLLDVLAIRQPACSEAKRKLARSVLGDDCFAVRGILFDKTDGANWKVTWHQDCVISVMERNEIPGWGPWSIKAGVNQFRPSSDIVSRMLAIRIHLRRVRSQERSFASDSRFTQARFPLGQADTRMAEECGAEWKDRVQEVLII
jgi:hypothetical protein